MLGVQAVMYSLVVYWCVCALCILLCTRLCCTRVSACVPGLKLFSFVSIRSFARLWDRSSHQQGLLHRSNLLSCLVSSCLVLRALHVCRSVGFNNDPGSFFWFLLFNYLTCLYFTLCALLSSLSTRNPALAPCIHGLQLVPCALLRGRGQVMHCRQAQACLGSSKHRT